MEREIFTTPDLATRTIGGGTNCLADLKSFKNAAFVLGGCTPPTFSDTLSMVDSREESDSRRYEHLLKWLKSHGMQLDGEHFHVQRKRRPGRVRISFSSRMHRLNLLSFNLCAGAGNGLYTTTALPVRTFGLLSLRSSSFLDDLRDLRSR